MSNYTDKVIKEFRERFTVLDRDNIPRFSADEIAIEQFLAEKLTALEAMYEEAIGEDEDTSDTREIFAPIVKVNGIRNKLREQIRKAVKEAKGE